MCTRKRRWGGDVFVPLFSCCWSCFISLLSTRALCSVTLLLPINTAPCPAVTQTQFGWHRQAGAGGGEVDFGDTLNGPSFPFAGNSQRTRLAFRRAARLLACSLRFGEKLTGKKENLRLGLCSNYTWHVSGREGEQSGKLAAKEDRGEDQEWHGLEFKLYSILYSSLLCLLQAAALLLTPVFFSFSPGWLQLSRLLLSDFVLFSVSPSVSVTNSSVWMCPQTACALTNGCSLCPGCTNLSLSVTEMHRNEMFFHLQNAMSNSEYMLHSKSQ